MVALGRRAMIVMCAACIGIALAPSAALALTTSQPAVTIPSARLETNDGRVLWSRHAGSSRRVASTIKMLNALVVRDRTNLNDVVRISARAARTQYGVGLVRGQRLTVRQLLRLMLIASANDAAEALAIHIGGSEAKYVALMNAKAKALGLDDTHAIDPHGLSKREHSTAADLADLGRVVMADPELRRIVRMRSVSLPRPRRAAVTLRSTDDLLGHYRGIKGVKTGFTNPAGFCFVGAAKREGVDLVSVVLGANSDAGRFSQTRALLNWGFAGFKTRNIVSTDTTMGVVTVINGVESSVTVHASREAPALVWTRGLPIKTRLVMPQSASAPIRRGDQLGVVRVLQGGVVLASVALLADRDIASMPLVPPPPVTDAPSQPASAHWGQLGDASERLLALMRTDAGLFSLAGSF